MGLRRGTAAVSAVGILAGLISGLAPADAVTKPPVPAPATSWATPTPSVHADPSSIVGRARSADGARVVAVFARGGHPVVRVWREPTRAKAVARVAAAQKNPTLVSIGTEVRQQFVDPVRSTRTSNDAHRPQQWALSRLQAESAWAVSRGAGVTVAVIDTGVAVHEDLQGAVVAGKDLVPATAGQQPGDGRNDGHGHGTHVAGIIAATPDNGIGVAGLAPDVSIMPVRVLDDSGSGYSSAVSNGIIWAADHGADIISLSLGGGYDANQAVAVAYAISRGVIVIAAAGNSRATGSPVSYPAAYPDVIAVGATTSSDAIASYSNRGAYVDIAAPGSAILSTLPSGYASWSGTSMATPYVSAAAALVLARARALGVVVNVPSLLTSTADDLGSPGVDPDFGSGIVDPVGALDALGSGTASLAAPTQLSGQVVSATRIDVSWQEPGDLTGIDSYRVTSSPGGVTCTVSVSTTNSCSLTGLSASTTYSITVRSIGQVTSSLETAPILLATPARPDAAGDSIADATPMPGPVVDELIDIPTDIDVWSTGVASAGAITVTLGNLPGDYDLYVYSSAGDRVGHSAGWGTTPDIARINVTAGRYYLEVRPFNGAFDAAAPYRLSVEFTPSTPAPPPPPAVGDAAGDSMASAATLAVDTVRDYITSGDQDFWTFTLNDTADVVLQLTELPADYDINLMRPDGTILATGSRPNQDAESISFQLTAGTYYAFVFGYMGSFSLTQPYALTLATAPVLPPDLGGNTLSEATPLGEGLIADDRINSAGDVDFWSFTVPALSRGDFALTQSMVDVDLALLRADGSVLARSRRPGAGDESASAWLVPGTYFLRVRSLAGSASDIPYHLAVVLRPLGREVLDQAGATAATAALLPPDGVDEIIHSPSDRDFWSLTVDATSRVTVTLSNLAADYDLALLRADGRLIARSARSGFTTETIALRLVPGRYLVRVTTHPGQWSMEDYHLVALATAVLARPGAHVRSLPLSSQAVTDTSLAATTLRATDDLGTPILSVDFTAEQGESRLVAGQLVVARASSRIFVGTELVCTTSATSAQPGFVAGRNVWPGLSATPVFGEFLLSVPTSGEWHCDLLPFVCTPPQCNDGPDIGTVTLADSARVTGMASYLSVSAPLAAGSSQRSMPPASAVGLNAGSLLIKGGSSVTASTTLKTVPRTPFTLDYVQGISNCIVESFPAACAGAPSVDDAADATLTPVLTIRQKATTASARCTVFNATRGQGARPNKVTWQEHHAQLRIVIPAITLSSAPGCSRSITVTVRASVSPGNSMTLERQNSAAPSGLVLAYASAP